jgi:hypothetical protein
MVRRAVLLQKIGYPTFLSRSYGEGRKTLHLDLSHDGLTPTLKRRKSSHHEQTAHSQRDQAYRRS